MPSSSTGRLASSRRRALFQGGCPRVYRLIAELVLDTQQPVVLRDPLGPRRRAGLDLAGIDCNCQVGDARVLGLTAAMADDGPILVRGGERDGLEGLGHGTDLVELDEDRVGDASIEAELQPLRVGHKDVIADQLHARPETVGEQLPSGPTPGRRVDGPSLFLFKCLPNVLRKVSDWSLTK